MLNEDLINTINYINLNFDFQTFSKDKLNEAEIVRLYYFKIFSFLEI